MITVDVEIENPVREDMSHVEVRALVDTGCTYLCIPESLADRLRLETAETLSIILADNSRRPVRQVGPVKIRYKGHMAFCSALVLGNEVLLGAVPLEELDFVVHPKSRTLEPNPRGIRV